VNRTQEQIADCQSVWDQIQARYPKFTRRHDPTDNYHGVREIVLGGSVSWAGAHERFKPFPGAKVLDLGANVGIYTAFCALHGAHVAAYEPDSETFYILSNMVKDTGLENAALNNAAVLTYAGRTLFRGFGSETCGRLERNGEAFGPGQTTSEGGYSAVVDCVSFDDAIGNTDWDCVKIDVEGAEYGMLLYASGKALRRIKFVYMELHPWVTQGLYEKTIDRLGEFFELEGGKGPNGRWEYLYLRRKP